MGIKRSKGTLTAEKQVEVLRRYEESGDFLGVKGEFGLTLREMRVVLAGAKWRRKRAAHIEGRSLRERLYERAVGAVEKSLAPIAEVIENNPLLTVEGMEHLATVVGHLKNSGQTAVKVLEGLGDFRKGGDEVPRDAPRQPMFNLPAGSHVAVTMEIRTGKGELDDGNGGGRAIECGGDSAETWETAESVAGTGDGDDNEHGSNAAVGSAVQVGEPSGGDGSDSGL